MFPPEKQAAKLATMLVAAFLATTASLASPEDTPTPAASPSWTSSDYVEAIFAVHNGKITLPRRGNPKTEALFERLIDRGNIERLIAQPEPVAEKSRQILIILSATGEFRGRYGYAVALGDDLRGELIDMQIFRLYLIDRLARLVRGEGQAPERCTGAIATTLLGTLDTLSESQVFTRDQLVALGAALTLHFSAIHPILGGSERQEITVRLAEMAKTERDPELRAAYATALAEVEARD
jgi:hypothetical protein